MTFSVTMCNVNDVLDKKYDILCELLEEGYSVTCADIIPDEIPSIIISHSLDQMANETKNNAIDIKEENLVSNLKAKQEERKKWKPWFPVIDYDRCTNCMQCMNFCLFGVYGVSEESKLQVQKAHNCKTDCPACSRVCPEAAIMFPKYKAGPINGDEVNEAQLEKEKMKVDISALLGGDIYTALRERNVNARARFSKERDENRALKERIRCLKKLQKDLDIPDSVLDAWKHNPTNNEGTK